MLHPCISSISLNKELININEGNSHKKLLRNNLSYFLSNNYLLHWRYVCVRVCVRVCVCVCACVCARAYIYIYT